MCSLCKFSMSVPKVMELMVTEEKDHEEVAARWADVTDRWIPFRVIFF